MKKLISCIFLLLVLTTGCSSLTSLKQTVFGKASKAQDKIQNKIDVFDENLCDLNKQKLIHIGAFAAGTQFALEQSTNRSDPVIMTAKQVNERVIALASKPDLEELKQVYLIVGNLLTNQVTGQKMLENKDKEIIKLNNKISEITENKDKQIKAAFILADKTAVEADTYQSTLKKLEGLGGMTMIYEGCKRLVIRFIWGISIFSVLFIILRIGSFSSPICSSIFSIFERIGSWFLNIIISIVPGAISKAKLVAEKVFMTYKSTLLKIVDSIQMEREKAIAAGKTPDLQQILDDVESTMTQEEKSVIEELKVALNYHRPLPTLPPTPPVVLTKSMI